MKTVHEVSELTGISVRALHHYDAIGLLKPTQITPAGYRLYDDAALSRLQAIMLFRELEFPLADIKAILDNPDYDEKEALKQQIHLLQLRREHIDGLISLVSKMIGENDKMSFKAFDKTEIEQYTEEAKQRWGNTKAWHEYEERLPSDTTEERKSSADGMMRIFAEIGKLKHLPPYDKAVQDEIAKLQKYITEHYYKCTDEIFAGLGKMYCADERFKENIDKAGGDGTAEFVSKGIEVYCGEKK
ncbi:MAG: MerR family transcriptional regulator [Clostridia bacterium]|nr:MerR family transcriptional regulator [Clostridia bacterium]